MGVLDSGDVVFKPKVDAKRLAGMPNRDSYVESDIF